MELHHYESGCMYLEHKCDDTPDPFYFVTHAHDQCELYYLISGEGYFTVEGVPYPLEKGSVLLIREGELHALHIDPSARYERITVNFRYDSVDPTGEWSGLRGLLYDREPGKDNLIRLGESSGYIGVLFDRLLLATEETGFDRDVAMKTILLAILTELVAIHKKNPDAHKISERPYDLWVNDIGKNEAKVVLSIIAYINENLFEIADLGEIESRFFFSRSYINRIFKAATGSSVWNYVLMKRLIAARQMLKSGVSAATVALRCGFRDYSSFYKQYKRKMGIAPTEEKNNPLTGRDVLMNKG